MPRFLLFALACLAMLGSIPSRPGTGDGLYSLAVIHRGAHLTGYTPAEVAAAYDLAGLQRAGYTGAGQAVALIEVDRYDVPDIEEFDIAFHLAAPYVVQTYVGGRFTPSYGGETTLDLEWLHALAPGAAIHIYYVNDHNKGRTNWKGVAVAVNQAVGAGIRTISISLGACRPTGRSARVRTALAAAITRGVSVFVSSGDWGDHAGSRRSCGKGIGVAYPASDPSVVSVGGTSLDLGQHDRRRIEEAWRGSGGGNGAPMPRPPWQQAAGLPHDRYRWVPDVAFLANPRPGVRAFFGGGWGVAGGTSLGAPAWAALWAILLQHAATDHVAVPAAPGVIYGVAGNPQDTGAFHDITTGSNGRYHAGPGWDAVTGAGSPDAAQFVAAAERMAAGAGRR